MYVKKIILDNIRLSYDGLINMQEFFDAVEQWKEKNGFEKEIKRHLEHNDPDGAKVEWFVEFWKEGRDYARFVVRFKAIFNNLHPVEVKKGKSKITLYNAQVLTLIDGILVQDVYGRWQQKPMFYFLRSIVDKLFYNFHRYKFEGEVEAYVHDLHKFLKGFFEEQRKKAMEQPQLKQALTGVPIRA